MKRIFSTIFFCFITAGISFAQNGSVGIGTVAPDASAVLDLKSDAKGLLIPRLTAAQRTALAVPAKGLLVYQTETPEGFYYNNGTPALPNWILLGATGPQGVPGPVGATGIVKGYYIAGIAPYPSNTLSFVSPTITITLQQGQSVFLAATSALGGYFAANDLCIYPAYQSTVPNGPIVNLGLGMCGHQVPVNTRISLSINGVFENLPAGTYKFGMSGLTSSPNWINSEWGYVSALVY